MFVTNWLSSIKVQNIYETTNFFINYFLSWIGVVMGNICKTVSLRTRKIKDGRMLPYYLDYYSGYRDVTFRASINTAYRDRKIKENPNGILERIETIPTDK